MKASTHWSMASTWQYVSIEYLKKKMYIFSLKSLKKKCISYPFSIRQSMVGEGCDEAGVHHPERISHALRHFSFSFSLLFAASIVRAIIICTINNPAAIIRANTIFMIIALGIITLASILFTIITFKAFMASSSVRSSPAKMILIRSLQATPNADRKMWIAAFPCIVRLPIISIMMINKDTDDILPSIIRLLIVVNLFI